MKLPNALQPLRIRDFRPAFHELVVEALDLHVLP